MNETATASRRSGPRLRLTMDESRPSPTGAGARRQDRPDPLRNPENAKNPALETYYRAENRPYAPYMFYGTISPREAGLRAQDVRRPDRRPGRRPATGGAPVLSHPAPTSSGRRGRTPGPSRSTACWASKSTRSTTRRADRLLRELAAELDLVATAGSDFHGRIKPHVAFGALREGDYGMVEALRARKGDRHELARLRSARHHLVTAVVGIVKGFVRQPSPRRGRGRARPGRRLLRADGGRLRDLRQEQAAEQFLGFLLIFGIVLVAGAILAISSPSMVGPLAFVNRFFGPSSDSSRRS